MGQVKTQLAQAANLSRPALSTVANKARNCQSRVSAVLIKSYDAHLHRMPCDG